jgi:hypothetical protein
MWKYQKSFHSFRASEMAFQQIDSEPSFVSWFFQLALVFFAPMSVFARLDGGRTQTTTFLSRWANGRRY